MKPCVPGAVFRKEYGSRLKNGIWQNFENKNKQILDFQKFIKNWDYSGNLVLVTHYVVISEILDLATSSGEIVITDTNLKFLSSLEIN